jgi:hypothetical protein
MEGCMKNAVIVILLLLLVWFGAALIRVENERYALFVGVCKQANGLTDFTCLRTVETRTSHVWHIYYALTNR